MFKAARQVLMSPVFVLCFIVVSFLSAAIVSEKVIPISWMMYLLILAALPENILEEE